MDLLVYAGVIIVYLLNLFFKKSSEERGRANEESPYGDSESLNDPFEEIRREILRKKKEREGLEEAEVELAMEADKARETEAKKGQPKSMVRVSFRCTWKSSLRELKKSKRRLSD